MHTTKDTVHKLLSLGSNLDVTTYLRPPKRLTCVSKHVCPMLLLGMGGANIVHYIQHVICRLHAEQSFCNRLF